MLLGTYYSTLASKFLPGNAISLQFHLVSPAFLTRKAVNLRSRARFAALAADARKVDQPERKSTSAQSRRDRVRVPRNARPKS